MSGGADLFDITGAAVVITGAASGIGRGLAIGLAAAGARVVAGDLRSEGLDEVAATIRDAGGDVATVVVDVTDAGDVDRLVATATEEFDALDVLINNAGVSLGGPVLDMEIDDWERVIDVDLTGVFRCAQAGARVMADRGGGVIINVSSQLGEVARRGRAAYCVAKAGVRMLTKALAVDLGPIGIRVNALAPGPIEVERTKPLLFGPGSETYRPRMLLGRYGQPDDLVGAARFLASPASSFMTGATLLVDGGYLAT